MDTTRDVAIARLAQALDVPAELLALPPERWNCATEHELKQQALAIYEQLWAERPRGGWSWEQLYEGPPGDPEQCYTVPCPSF